MGRPKLPEGEGKTSRLSIKVRPRWLAWLWTLADKAGDPSVSAMIERLAAKEAKRLKHPPPPER